jgi:hypothetical protein
MDDGAHRAASKRRISSSLLTSSPDMARGDQRLMKIGEISWPGLRNSEMFGVSAIEVTLKI